MVQAQSALNVCSFLGCPLGSAILALPGFSVTGVFGGWTLEIRNGPGWADGGSGGTYSFGHGLAEMLHPVSHLSLAVCT